MSHALRPIFEPRSVAVIGASSDPDKRGYQVVAALRASGFPGSIYPVNPRGGELLGLPVCSAIEDLPEAPDLAYVARPASAAPAAVEACGRRGIAGAIVPAVGFGETGAEGAALEGELLAAARETGIRLLGPNTSGLLNTHAGLHMVGGEPLPPGRLGLVLQSGNVALDLMTAGSARPVGVSIYVGPGNETDIGFHEILDFLGTHEPTRAIAMYVEGVKDGRALYETARRVAPRKPVVVLKGGRSRRGREAARSHTGAVAGSHEVFLALARQAGMRVVERSDELLAVAETLALQPPSRAAADVGSGVVILSDGGGHATLAADRLTGLGVELARLGETSRSRLRDLLGPAAAVGNPIDCAGATDRSPAAFARALEIAVADPACTAVLMIGLFGGYAIRFADRLAAEELATADALAETAKSAGVPLVLHSLYARREPAPLARLLERDVPVFDSLETAAAAVSARVGRRLASATRRTSAGAAGAERPIDPAPGDGKRRSLSESAARDLAESFGVPFVPATRCSTATEAAEAARTGDRFSLKAISAHLPHKTEAGAVALDLAGPEAVEQAFERVRRSARSYLRDRGLPEEIEGALVSPMQPPPLAQLLIGARRDPQFGPILTIGRGGTDVEVDPDVAIRALPAERTELEGALDELRLAPTLLGHRGRAPADPAPIVDIAMALGRLLLDRRELDEVELNPVFVYADRAMAIDASGFALDV